MAFSKEFWYDYEELRIDWEARSASVDAYLKTIQPKIDEALIADKLKLMPTRALRKLNERRKRMVRAFVEEFAENPEQYPRYGSEEWINAMIKYFRDPPATRILPQDVKYWLKCEPFFEVINEVYGHFPTIKVEPKSTSLSGCEIPNFHGKGDTGITGGDMKVRTSLRRLNGRRRRMIQKFLEEFEANPQIYAAYGTEDWISSMIDYFMDPRCTRILTQDVKHWLATEPFFEEINKRYEYCPTESFVPKREPFCSPVVKDENGYKKEKTGSTKTIMSMIDLDEDDVICLE